MGKFKILPLLFILILFTFGCTAKRLDEAASGEKGSVGGTAGAGGGTAEPAGGGNTSDEKNGGDRDLLLELLESQLQNESPKPEENQDIDYDGFLNMADNCPTVHNKDQKDLDGDGWGDKCDDDRDGDTILNADDNCPDNPNPSQSNSDIEVGGGDKIGDVCDKDKDNDDRQDEGDNCPEAPNYSQQDSDKDGEGDACDEDVDGDAVPNEEDNCKYVKNEDQADTDDDGVGDACTDDADGDGISDANDNCPLFTNEDQLNTDADAEGDACDDDDDNDSVLDAADNCALLANAEQQDTDDDGQGDACDADDDGDGIPDENDKCPMLAVNEPELCDSSIDGVLMTILNPVVNGADYFKDFNTVPGGFYQLSSPLAVEVLKHGSGKDEYTIYYVGMNDMIQRLRVENGVPVPDKSGYFYNGDFDSIRAIARVPGKDDYLIFLGQTTYKVGDVYKYRLSLWRVQLNLDDFGNVLMSTAKKMDLGDEFNDSLYSFYQFSIGVKKFDGGYKAYITRGKSVGKDAQGKEIQGDIDANKVFVATMDDSLNLTGVSELALPTPGDIRLPRSTFVHRYNVDDQTDDILYIGMFKKLIRVWLDANGDPVKNDFIDTYAGGQWAYYPNGFAVMEGHDGYVFFSNSGSGIFVLRGDYPVVVATGTGYYNCDGNCGNPAKVGTYDPYGMAFDGNRLVIAEGSNRAIRALDLSIDDGVTVSKSEFIEGQLPAEYAHHPESGPLEIFYHPYGIRVVPRPGTSILHAYIVTHAWHKLWLVKIDEDKVTSLEELANSSKILSPRYAALVDGGSEWRLYISSDYPYGDKPRLFLQRIDKDTALPKGDVEKVWFGENDLYNKVYRIAASPDNKFIYFVGEKGGRVTLSRITMNDDGTIVAGSAVDFMANMPWATPKSVAAYRDANASDGVSSDYLLVAESHTVAGANVEGVYRAKLDENGDPSNAELIIGPQSGKTPGVEASLDGTSPADTKINSIREILVLDNTLYFTDYSSYSKILSYDLKADDPKLKLVIKAKYLPIVDGKKDNIGSHAGLENFDVWRFGDSAKGLLITDYHKHALRLLR